jgi:hypothetical protein
MSNVITVCYSEDSSRWYPDPDIAFREATDLLAQSFKTYGSQVNFGIIESEHISDICFSSQSFHERDLEEALRRVGVEEVKVQGICGGSRDHLEKKISEYGSGVLYINNILPGNHSVLYRFERQG